MFRTTFPANLEPVLLNSGKKLVYKTKTIKSNWGMAVAVTVAVLSLTLFYTPKYHAPPSCTSLSLRRSLRTPSPYTFSHGPLITHKYYHVHYPYFTMTDLWKWCLRVMPHDRLPWRGYTQNHLGTHSHFVGLKNFPAARFLLHRGCNDS